MGQLTAIAAGVQAFTSIVGAKQQGDQLVANAKFQQQQYESAAKDEMLASTQEEAIRRKELNDTLATIDAIRSARGLSLRSPTGRVINKTEIDNSDRNVGIAKTNRLIKADQYKRQGAYGVSTAKAEKSSLIMSSIGKSVSLLGKK